MKEEEKTLEKGLLTLEEEQFFLKKNVDRKKTNEW